MQQNPDSDSSDSDGYVVRKKDVLSARENHKYRTEQNSALFRRKKGSQRSIDDSKKNSDGASEISDSRPRSEFRSKKFDESQIDDDDSS